MNGFFSRLKISHRRQQPRHRRFLVPLALAIGLVGTARPARTESTPSRSAQTAAQTAAQIDSLLSQLRHKSAARRREALLQLTDAQLPAERLLPHIGRLLGDDDRFVRIHAARAVWLTGQHTDVAVATLIELLRPDEPPVCALASFLTGEIGPAAAKALPALRARMTEPDSLLRMHAAEAIVKIDSSNSAAHTVLIRAVRDPSPDLRYFAACALINTGETFREPACGALLAALADDDLRVASAAALSLENWQAARPASPAADDEHGGELPIHELFRWIDSLSDSSILVRRQAALRLAERGSVAHPAQTALQIAVDDNDPVVRAYAAQALWQIDPQTGQVLPVLIDLLGTLHPNVTTLATSGLARMGESAADALPALYDLMETSDPLVRLHVAIAISRIDPRGRHPIQIMTDATHSGDSDRRYLGVLSLGHVSLLSRKRAERELTAALTDRNLRVRSAAARALDNLQAAAAHARVAASQAATRSPTVGTFDDPAVSRRASPAAKARPAQVVALHTQPDAEPSPGVIDEGSGDDPAAIPILEEEPAPESADRQGLPRLSPDEEETVEERKGIGQLRARITPSKGDMPTDYATRRFERAPSYYHGYGMARGWYNSSIAWNNPGIAHHPLWFQDLNLERYGYNYGIGQTLVSSVKFCADAALLPYNLIAQPPCDCVYTLGYDRPGNCVPYRCYRLPWRPEAALFIGGVTTGLVFLAL